MTREPGESWWKYTATALLGMVASGTVGWFSLWSVGMYRWHTDEQVRAIFQNESKPSQARIERTEETMKAVLQRYDTIIEGQSELKTQTALIQATLQRMEKERDGAK